MRSQYRALHYSASRGKKNLEFAIAYNTVILSCPDITLSSLFPVPAVIIDVLAYVKVQRLEV